MSETTETADRAITRTRKVLAGEGMLQCVKSFRYRGRAFLAGKTRVAPDHEAVAAMPTAFEPAMVGDEDPDVQRFAAEQGLTTRTTSGEPMLGLDHEPTPGRETWRL